MEKKDYKLFISDNKEEVQINIPQEINLTLEENKDQNNNLKQMQLPMGSISIATNSSKADDLSSPLILSTNIDSAKTAEETMTEEMAHWFSSKIKIVHSDAELYAKLLYKKGIGSIEKLTKKLQKNRQFLSDEKEIDEDDLELIIEKLTSQNSQVVLPYIDFETKGPITIQQKEETKSQYLNEEKIEKPHHDSHGEKQEEAEEKMPEQGNSSAIKAVLVSTTAQNAANEARSAAAKAIIVSNPVKLLQNIDDLVTLEYDGEVNNNNKQDGYGVQKWSNGEVYEGQFKDGICNGFGVCKYVIGHIYEGEWLNGKKQGGGVYKWPNGDVYEGEFEDEKRNGFGVCKYISGNLYEGEWRNGKKHGDGVFYWLDGHLYEGGFIDGKKNGKGIKKYKNGKIDDGNWENDKFVSVQCNQEDEIIRNRKQKEDAEKQTSVVAAKVIDASRIAQNAAFEARSSAAKAKSVMNAKTKNIKIGNLTGEYVGEMDNNNRHGYGIEIWSNGDMFEGEYKEDKPHGFGVYKYISGDKYEGEFSNGRIYGHGIYEKSDGEIYKGEWKDDKRNGYGICRWPNGNVYTGELKDDLKHGKGVAKYASGSVYDGEYKEGKRHGYGVYKWFDGTMYEGEYKGDKKHGFGVSKYADGQVKDGCWENDKFVGTNKCLIS